MKKSLPFIALIGFCPIAFAQQPPPEGRDPYPTYQKPPGLMKRLFGSRLEPGANNQPRTQPESYAPAPAPSARQGRRPLFADSPDQNYQAPEPDVSVPERKPKPRKRKPKSSVAKKKSAPAPKVAKADAPDSTPPAPETTAPAVPAVTDPSATPAPGPAGTDPLATPPPAPAPAPVAPKKPRKGKTAVVAAEKPPVDPVATPEATPEVSEKARFDEAKLKASSDPEVADLKAKADAAVTDEEARIAQRAYNTALFKKMREIDATLKDHIDAMEAAILKRLEQP